MSKLVTPTEQITTTELQLLTLFAMLPVQDNFSLQELPGIQIEYFTANFRPHQREDNRTTADVPAADYNI